MVVRSNVRALLSLFGHVEFCSVMDVVQCHNRRVHTEFASNAHWNPFADVNANQVKIASTLPNPNAHWTAKLRAYCHVFLHFVTRKNGVS